MAAHEISPDDLTDRESAVFWREPGLCNLELLRARFVTHSFPPHAHDGYAIGVIESGAETFAYRRSVHVAPAGQVVVINPGELHTGQSANGGGWSYRMIYPDPSLLQRAAAEVAGGERALPFFGAPVFADPVVAGFIRRLHLAFEDQATSGLERESRLLWTLTHLVARHADDRPPLPPAPIEHDYVRRVRRYLDDHYADACSLDDLAALVHVSPFHLLRAFRAAVGWPPHAYLTQVRVARAKALLAADVAPAEVAARTGFADQSHLSKQFKRIVGIAPGHYRRAAIK